MGVDNPVLVEFRLEFEQRPWTTNTERTWNRYKRAEIVKVWRGAFFWLAKQQKIPPMKWITVSAEPHQKMGVLQDVASCNPAVKSAIDGLVDAGVLPDDSSEYMRSLTFLPPVKGKNSLVIIVKGEPA
jgi:crossover junction endodeoxyribonuclease RusA